MEIWRHQKNILKLTDLYLMPMRVQKPLSNKQYSHGCSNQVNVFVSGCKGIYIRFALILPNKILVLIILSNVFACKSGFFYLQIIETIRFWPSIWTLWLLFGSCVQKGFETNLNFSCHWVSKSNKLSGEFWARQAK